MEFYTKEERLTMSECDCMLHKVVMVLEAGEGQRGIFDKFGEMVSRGMGYVELVYNDGRMWRKDVWVFGSGSGMDRYLVRYPGHQRFIGRDV